MDLAVCAEYVSCSCNLLPQQGALDRPMECITACHVLQNTAGHCKSCSAHVLNIDNGVQPQANICLITSAFSELSETHGGTSMALSSNAAAAAAGAAAAVAAAVTNSAAHTVHASTNRTHTRKPHWRTRPMHNTATQR